MDFNYVPVGILCLWFLDDTSLSKFLSVSSSFMLLPNLSTKIWPHPFYWFTIIFYWTSKRSLNGSHKFCPGLEKVWELKPLANGMVIMNVLQLKDGGPLVREWVCLYCIHFFSPSIYPFLVPSGQQRRSLAWQLVYPHWYCRGLPWLDKRNASEAGKAGLKWSIALTHYDWLNFMIETPKVSWLNEYILVARLCMWD